MARLAVAFAALVLVLVLAGGAAGSTDQSRTLVTFQWTGGFIGKQDSMTVLRNGAVTSSNGPFRLTLKRRLRLENTLRSARFPTLRTEYMPEDPVADGYLYAVRYAGRRVSVGQGAHPPDRLQRVLDLLADIFSRRT